MSSGDLSDESARASSPVPVVLFIRRSPERFLPTVLSVLRVLPESELLIGAPALVVSDVHETMSGLSEPSRIRIVEAYSAAELVNQVAGERRTHVLALDDAVILPEGFLDNAVPVANDDPRVVAVCFLCNAAGYLSFPYHLTPAHHQIEDLDETTLTLRLRDLEPAPEAVPIPYAAGGAILFTEAGLLALGPIAVGITLRLEVAAADHSIRGVSRGMVTLLDSGTFYSRPSDVALLDQSTFLEPQEVEQLRNRNPGSDGLLDHGREEGVSPRSLAMRVSRVKTLGLRLLIEASAVGPKEMGTQVQTLSLLAELSDHPDVASIAVGLWGPIPRYADKVLSHRKVTARTCPPNDYSSFGIVDVAHRPFQPDLGFESGGLAAAAERSLITMQDLIAYQVAPYHRTDEDWYQVRSLVRSAVASADGVVVISRDTRMQLEREKFPVDSDRIHLAENGTDHLTGNEPEVLPRELVRRGFASGDFVLVLGANYAHKNRELAIRTLTELRSRGHRLDLICVGAQVPHGSVRPLEARAVLDSQRLFGDALHTIIVPDVASEERNWLLRHARLVLYPTSAEGFGLVPFEAATFGTATVTVPFGPVAEVAPDLPVTADAWDASVLADACERLLGDPSLYDAQVEAVRLAGTNYTWRRTADLLVDAYRRVLAAPRRSA